VHVPYPVAKPVQHKKEGHDADGHAFASNLLEVIEHVCTYEKAKPESSNKTSNKGKKGKKHHGTNSMARALKKAHFEKHCNLCKKNGGAYTTHNTRDCHRFKKDRKEKSNSTPLRKVVRKQIP
jgi:hypothetical protein